MTQNHSFTCVSVLRMVLSLVLLCVCGGWSKGRRFRASRLLFASLLPPDPWAGSCAWALFPALASKPVMCLVSDIGPQRPEALDQFWKREQAGAGRG